MAACTDDERWRVSAELGAYDGKAADAEAQLWKLGAACVLGMSVKECEAVDKLLAKCQEGRDGDR